jgi:5-methyltetrahydrofolate--homocysteine methyltransferase
VNPGFRPVEITPENPYRTPDALFDAARAFLDAGAQFLRAVGHATPSYTGALVIAGDGRDCVR